jgi:hypothetical protein
MNLPKLETECHACKGQPTQFYTCAFCDGRGKLPTEAGLTLLKFVQEYGGFLTRDDKSDNTDT